MSSVDRRPGGACVRDRPACRLASHRPPQRAYRAACPDCGAPVEFRRRAVAVRGLQLLPQHGRARAATTLREIGKSAELFDDHSPLQLGAAGRYQGAPFTLVGRLQYRYADGTWNEWHALFDERRAAGRAGARTTAATCSPAARCGARRRRRPSSCALGATTPSTARAGASPRTIAAR